MKKILPTLLVLLLSMAVIGCGPLEEEEDVPCAVCGEETCICQLAGKQNLSDKAKGYLTEMGLTEADVLCPVGTTFHDCDYFPITKMIVIYWKDANQAMFKSYNDAWLALPNRASVTDKSAFTNATIEFFAKGATSELTEITYPDGTISFTGTGKK